MTLEEYQYLFEQNYGALCSMAKVYAVELNIPANDLVHRAYEHFFRNLKSLHITIPVEQRSWMFRGVFKKQLYYEFLHRLKVENHNVLSYAHTYRVDDTTYNPSDDLQMHIDVKRAVKKLPSKYQKAVQYIMDGYSSSEASKVSRIPASTIREQWSYVRRILKQELRDYAIPA